MWSLSELLQDPHKTWILKCQYPLHWLHQAFSTNLWDWSISEFIVLAVSCLFPSSVLCLYWDNALLVNVQLSKHQFDVIWKSTSPWHTQCSDGPYYCTRVLDSGLLFYLAFSNIVLNSSSHCFVVEIYILENVSVLDKGGDRPIIWLVWTVRSSIHCDSWQVSTNKDSGGTEGAILSGYMQVFLVYYGNDFLFTLRLLIFVVWFFNLLVLDRFKNALVVIENVYYNIICL